MKKSEQWKIIINEWKSSGLSQKEYCQTHNLKVHALHYWLRKLTAVSHPNDSFVAFSSPSVSSRANVHIGHVQITLELTDIPSLLIELQQAGLLYDQA